MATYKGWNITAISGAMKGSHPGASYDVVGKTTEDVVAGIEQLVVTGKAVDTTNYGYWVKDQKTAESGPLRLPLLIGVAVAAFLLLRKK